MKQVLYLERLRATDLGRALAAPSAWNTFLWSAFVIQLILKAQLKNYLVYEVCCCFTPPFSLQNSLFLHPQCSYRLFVPMLFCLIFSSFLSLVLIANAWRAGTRQAFFMFEFMPPFILASQHLAH